MVRLLILLTVCSFLQSSVTAQFVEPTTAADTPGSDNYVLGPDSKPQEGVPKGKVTKHSWTTSTIFPNSTRDYWVYVPAQYDGTKPAAVMVLQDGAGFVNVEPNGGWRVPDVFDNLIHKKEMPVTIGILINPGSVGGRSNRAFEYDTLSDQYARFLLEEILPEVGKTYKLTTDPEGRGIAGSSSGAICAFTVAWERPNEFRKVASFIGSYTSIGYRPAQDGKPMQPGGDLYPGMIRKTPAKPIKIFLQDGSADLNNNHGSWFLANQQMLSSLEFANTRGGRGARGGRRGGRAAAADAQPQTPTATQTPGTTPAQAPAATPDSAANPTPAATPAPVPPPRYVINHVWGDGGHNSKHGGSILPDVMRWLWSGYTPKE